MCGIAGILYKGAASDAGVGRALVDMLDGCQHRGPDSTGFSLYRESRPGHLRLRFIVGEGDDASKAIERVKAKLAEFQAKIVEEEQKGSSYAALVKFDGDLQKFAFEMEHAAKLSSIGESLDIIKDLGGAHDVDNIYKIENFKGTHGIGHVRLATESDVAPEATHPFWATGFADISIVHNGQITNYWNKRRDLERRGHRFVSNCDSELLAVYTADNLEQGATLLDSLKQSVEEIDGVFTYIIATKDELGMAKDTMAAKPLVLFESDETVALASEEIAIRAVFPQEIDTFDPYEGEVRVWKA